MKTEAEFKAALKALLREYDVEMSIQPDEDDNDVINFFRYARWDNDGNMITEDIDWNVRWMKGDQE